MDEQQVLSAIANPEAFRCLIGSFSDLVNVVDQFPQHAEKVIPLLLSQPEEFRRVIDSGHALGLIAKQLIAHGLPQLAEALIQPLLSQPEEFRRLIKYAYELQLIAQQFPQREEALIYPLLSQPEEFRRVIKYPYEDLKSMAAQFPQHAEIFGQATIEAAIHAIETRRSRSEIVENASLLSQASRTPFTAGSANFFQQTPREARAAERDMQFVREPDVQPREDDEGFAMACISRSGHPF